MSCARSKGRRKVAERSIPREGKPQRKNVESIKKQDSLVVIEEPPVLIEGNVAPPITRIEESHEVEPEPVKQSVIIKTPKDSDTSKITQAERNEATQTGAGCEMDCSTRYSSLQDTSYATALNDSACSINCNPSLEFEIYRPCIEPLNLNNLCSVHSVCSNGYEESNSVQQHVWRPYQPNDQPEYILVPTYMLPVQQTATPEPTLVYNQPVVAPAPPLIPISPNQPIRAQPIIIPQITQLQSQPAAYYDAPQISQLQSQPGAYYNAAPIGTRSVSHYLQIAQTEMQPTYQHDTQPLRSQSVAQTMTAPQLSQTQEQPNIYYESQVDAAKSQTSAQPETDQLPGRSIRRTEAVQSAPAQQSVNNLQMPTSSGTNQQEIQPTTTELPSNQQNILENERSLTAQTTDTQTSAPLSPQTNTNDSQIYTSARNVFSQSVQPRGSQLSQVYTSARSVFSQSPPTREIMNGNPDAVSTNTHAESMLTPRTMPVAEFPPSERNSMNLHGHPTGDSQFQYASPPENILIPRTVPAIQYHISPSPSTNLQPISPYSRNIQMVNVQPLQPYGSPNYPLQPYGTPNYVLVPSKFYPYKDNTPSRFSINAPIIELPDSRTSTPKTRTHEQERHISPSLNTIFPTSRCPHIRPAIPLPPCRSSRRRLRQLLSPCEVPLTPSEKLPLMPRIPSSRPCDSGSCSKKIPNYNGKKHKKPCNKTGEDQRKNDISRRQDRSKIDEITNRYLTRMVFGDDGQKRKKSARGSRGTDEKRRNPDENGGRTEENERKCSFEQSQQPPNTVDTKNIIKGDPSGPISEARNSLLKITLTVDSSNNTSRTTVETPQTNVLLLMPGSFKREETQRLIADRGITRNTDPPEMQRTRELQIQNHAKDEFPEVETPIRGRAMLTCVDPSAHPRRNQREIQNHMNYAQLECRDERPLLPDSVSRKKIPYTCTDSIENLSNITDINFFYNLESRTISKDTATKTTNRGGRRNCNVNDGFDVFFFNRKHNERLMENTCHLTEEPQEIPPLKLHASEKKQENEMQRTCSTISEVLEWAFSGSEDSLAEDL